VAIEVLDRKELARYLLSRGADELGDAISSPAKARELGLAETRALDLTFPEGLAPAPKPISPKPDPQAPLPKADVVVITWTVDEVNALADVLTPKFRVAKWYQYKRHFEDRYASRIRKGAPSMRHRMLGSYFLSQVGDHSVLCFKSELHLNQDGVKTGDGTATLPVKDLFLQIVDEAKPKVILTVGTAGSVFLDFGLGDVVVTRAAKFRLSDEFSKEAFNAKVFKNDWTIPTKHLDTAEKLMQQVAANLAEPPFGPPTKRFPFDEPLIEPPANHPKIRLDGKDMKPFHPILTTDYFEFGTSANHLDEQGAAVEMGDAVLGLALAEVSDPPKWAVVRNMSDPQINGDLPDEGFRLNQQTEWAVAYYLNYGYHTSVCSALATWGIIAGLKA
jgi:hypothetical protein